tara:strand:+ start:880 stop:1641 length:762 start_codon:yes stop_codon:yes gene_type:complete
MTNLYQNKFDKKTIIILPCYNEETRLRANEINDFVSSQNGYDILFVNDGSTDSTEKIIKKICSLNRDRIFQVNLAKNSGKAEAIRFGFNYIINNLDINNISFIAYLDSDLSTHLTEIARIKKIAQGDNISADFISGIRLVRAGSKIKRSFVRHIISRVFSTVASFMFKLYHYDTQCGCKIFTVKIGKEIFEEKFATKWLFDIEIYLRLKRKQLDENIVEVPLLKWEEIGKSHIKITDFILAPILLIKLFIIYR